MFLRNVSVWTEGRFTCQVSADEPHFGCVQAHKDVTVHGKLCLFIIILLLIKYGLKFVFVLICE